MNPKASREFRALTAQVAKINGVDNVNEKFAVAPAAVQRLYELVREKTDFLSKINYFFVTAQKGEKIGVGVSRPIASTSDTKNGTSRTAKNVLALDNYGYFCQQINYDSSIRYSQLDAWSHLNGGVQIPYRNAITQQIARDHLMIGFNGIQRTADSDITTSPLLQDVAVGWLEKIRTEAPTQVYKEGTPSSNKITVGPGGDYHNLDALVLDAKNTFIAEWHKNDSNLVAICQSDIMATKLLDVIDRDNPATESLASNILIQTSILGGLHVETPSFMKPNTILITTLDNISVYVQSETVRRLIIDEPKLDQVSDFQSANEDFIIEDYGKCVLIENIEFVV